MNYAISVLTLIGCTSFYSKELSYQKYLTSCIENSFSQALAERKMIYVILVKAKENQFDFIVYENFNYPSVGYLPVRSSRLKESYVFFYDYRFKPMRESEVTFPVGKERAIYNTAFKTEYIIVTKANEEFTYKNGDLNKGIRLYNNPKLFKWYE